MSRLLRALFCAAATISFTPLVIAQKPPQSDPQAISFAAQSITALTGGTPINDVTLTGSATWTAGSDTQTGNATLIALGTAESRIDLALTSGTTTEIRDAQTGTSLGKWITPGGSGYFATQNCWTDPAWFFPALSSLSARANVVLSYIGAESFKGAAVQHIQSYIYQQVQAPPPTPQQLSTMDFYLDAGTLLPTAIVFNTHPDVDMSTNIPIEIDFSSYQQVAGIVVPMHIQKFVQGSLTVETDLSSVTINSGLSLSPFQIN